MPGSSAAAAAAGAAAASAAARRARERRECEAYLQSFDQGHVQLVTVPEKQHFANCVGLVHPENQTPPVAGFVVFLVVIGLLVFFAWATSR